MLNPTTTLAAQGRNLLIILITIEIGRAHV